ncbi:MAG: C-type lectin domain-containing protein [Myxococcota bacterium]|nr:C-type lectin domain-containing protein [Deltaproteobacteria bacterium]MDQ3340094.1 C-type lectin domain-containing protein [Myxococcota bacterium]
MRALALLALTGCRSILGIEDGTELPPPGADSGGSDGNVVDGSVDSGLNGCPPDFMPLPNSGPRGHRYRREPSPNNWVKMRDACAQEGSFLAFPDGASGNVAQLELDAIVTFAGNGVWLGITDVTNEGSYRTSLDLPASMVTLSLITSAGSPQIEDCVVGSSAMTATDEDCTDIRLGVCECVP